MHDFFDLKFLGVILICAVNMHDFFQIFSQCLNLNLGRMSPCDMQKVHVTWSLSEEERERESWGSASVC